MKTLLTSTALALITLTPAYGESQTAADPATNAAPEMATERAADGTPMHSPFIDSETANAQAAIIDLRASDLIGKRIYTSEEEWSEQSVDDVSGNWNDIGEVSDIVLAKDGSSEAVLLDIGGFLGIGERTVAVKIDALEFVRDGDDAGDYFVVLTADRATLETAPEFDESKIGAWTSAAITETKDAANRTKDKLAATASDAKNKLHNMTANSSAPMEGFVMVDADKITAEQLDGQWVYDATGEHIGEVSEINLNADGKVSDVIIDVGGFLGMGEKPVALAYDEIKLQRAKDGDELRVNVNATKEELEAMPEYGS